MKVISNQPANNRKLKEETPRRNDGCPITKKTSAMKLGSKWNGSGKILYTETLPPKSTVP